MGDYIMGMRKLVGHKCLIQCAASIIVVNEKNEILLGLRDDTLNWCYSGGSVEIDEKPEDCAKRELMEEMGLEALELEFFMINAGPEAHFVYPNGDEVSNVEVVYICRKYQGQLKNVDGEMIELRFFDIDDLPSNLSRPIQPVINEYLRRNKQ